MAPPHPSPHQPPLPWTTAIKLLSKSPWVGTQPSFEGHEPTVAPLTWQSSKVILFYFTPSSIFEIQSGISTQSFLASVVNLGAYYVLKSKGEKRAEKRKEKKKRATDWNSRIKENQTLVAWALSIMCANVPHMLVCRTHIQGEWTGLEGSLRVVAHKVSPMPSLQRGLGNWQHMVKTQPGPRVHVCCICDSRHPSFQMQSGRLRAPFQGTITQSTCRFLETNIYCFNSCTPTFLDLKKKN